MLQQLLPSCKGLIKFCVSNLSHASFKYNMRQLVQPSLLNSPTLYRSGLHSLPLCPSRHEKKITVFVKIRTTSDLQSVTLDTRTKNQEERTLGYNRPLQYTGILKQRAALYRQTDRCLLESRTGKH